MVTLTLQTQVWLRGLMTKEPVVLACAHAFTGTSKWDGAISVIGRTCAFHAALHQKPHCHTRHVHFSHSPLSRASEISVSGFKTAGIVNKVCPCNDLAPLAKYLLTGAFTGLSFNWSVSVLHVIYMNAKAAFSRADIRRVHMWTQDSVGRIRSRHCLQLPFYSV